MRDLDGQAGLAQALVESRGPRVPALVQTVVDGADLGPPVALEEGKNAITVAAAAAARRARPAECEDPEVAVISGGNVDADLFGRLIAGR